MKYFAYGSNMLARRLKDPSRAPSAEYLGVAALAGYQLYFHKRGKDGSSKCNALLTADAKNRVYGVVYDIDNGDAQALDQAEDALRRGYFRKQVVVALTGGEERVVVDSYFANPEFIDESIKPFHWYKALVVAGASEHDLEAEYVEMIRRVPSIDDPKSDRSDEVRELLGPSWRDHWPEI